MVIITQLLTWVQELMHPDLIVAIYLQDHQVHDAPNGIVKEKVRIDGHECSSHPK